jgi:hypothetical protein
MFAKESLEQLATGHRTMPPVNQGTRSETDRPAPSTEGSATLCIDWPQLIRDLLAVILPRSDDVLSSPVKLGALLTICAELAEIEPVVRERATTLAIRNQEIPGWIPVRQEGNCYVEKERLQEVCRKCPVSNLEQLFARIAAQQGNVSERKYLELCESAGVEPDRGALKQAKGTVSLRRKVEKNARATAGKEPLPSSSSRVAS